MAPRISNSQGSNSGADSQDAGCHTLSLNGSVVVPYLIQGILGLACLTTLLIKRHLERPQRPWKIWFADCSKQVIAALTMHAWNILFAVWLKAASSHLHSDECAWYVVNISVDTVFGVFMGYFLLRILEREAKRRGWERLANSGDYGDPIDWKTWLAQLLVWILIVMIYKFVLILFIFIFLQPLAGLSWALMAPLRPYPTLELIVVMIVTPLVMNAWVSCHHHLLCPSCALSPSVCPSVRPSVCLPACSSRSISVSVYLYISLSLSLSLSLPPSSSIYFESRLFAMLFRFL
jgi:hypothetical protein